MTQLASMTIAHEGQRPERWLLATHGIYGRGRNLTAMARRLVALRPDWGLRLVDLRGHGDSPPGDPPQTVAAAAADVRALTDGHDVRADALLGHSFGGKVVLALLREPGVRPAQVWVIDASPSARAPSGSAWQMLEAARALPGPFPARSALVEALAERGFSPDVGQWMASNLERDGDVYRWRLDFDAMEALLRDFFALDLWPIVDDPPDGVSLHFVRADRSSAIDEDAVARLDKAARRTGRVHLHVLQGGHWIHAERPDDVAALVAGHLP